MTIDLNTLSTKELADLISQARKRKTTLSKRKPLATVRTKLMNMAKTEGYSIAELFGGQSTRASAASSDVSSPASGAKRGRRPSVNKGRKLGKVPAKYRNPANTKETWSGRGKQPRWMSALTKKGKKQDDFLIKK